MSETKITYMRDTKDKYTRINKTMIKAKML